MGETTSRLALPYPVSTDAPNGPSQVESLADALDSVTVVFSAGSAADRPSSPDSGDGTLYYATDSNELSYYNGSAWIALGPLNTTAGNIEALTFGASAAAGSSGLAADAEHVHTIPTPASFRGYYGPPDSGTWVEGEIVVDSTGQPWVCTEGGSPGTWQNMAVGLTEINGEAPVFPPLVKIGEFSGNYVTGGVSIDFETAFPHDLDTVVVTAAAQGNGGIIANLSGGGVVGVTIQLWANGDEFPDGDDVTFLWIAWGE